MSPSLAKAIVSPPVLGIKGDGAGGCFIRFSGIPGSAYRLQRAPSVTGPWTASPPFTLLATNLPGLPGTTIFTHTNAMGLAPLFYRVGVED